MQSSNSQLPDCAEENVFYSYISSQEKDLERLQAHIVGCQSCSQKLAAYARFNAEPTDEELEFENKFFDQVEVSTRKLVKKELEAGLKTEPVLSTPVLSTPVPSTPSPKQAVTDRDFFKSLFSWRFSIPVLASILVIFIGVTIWKGYYAPNTYIERGMSALNEATRQNRLLELRITGLDYSPYLEMRGNDSTMKNNKIDAAVGLLENAVAKNPEPESRHALGRALIVAGKYSDAIKELKIALSDSPESAGIQTDLAVACVGNNDLDSAIKYLNRAIEIDPARPEPIFNRAILYKRMENHDAERLDWKRYLEADPSSPWAMEARKSLAILESK